MKGSQTELRTPVFQSPPPRFQRTLLLLRVHLDALRIAPLAYLQGVVWRLRGLKLRSRARMSSLTGRSPASYHLWIATKEPALMAAYASATNPARATIIPVIDCRGSSDGLQATLQSMQGSGVTARPVTIGGIEATAVHRIVDPMELARVIGNGPVWILPIVAGDTVAAVALNAYAAATATSASTVIYSDDDLVGEDGARHGPHFKPTWNVDLFEHHDYLTGSCIIKTTPEMLSDLGNAWPAALVSKAARTDAPEHLPLVLHHRRARPNPLVPAKAKLSISGSFPRVTIIIPTRNQLALLRSCMEGVRATDYPNVATIVIDNGSDDPATLSFLDQLVGAGVTVLHMPGPFNFSALNNAAVQAADGDYLCFLNNDVETIDGDWLGIMVAQAMRPEIGAVGARLLYPDGTIQHAGVVTGIGKGAGHAHRLQQASDRGYFNRVQLPQRASAVTAACLVVARDKFVAVGGFDEVDFPVAFNDVDLCLKLRAHGWESFYEPRATLIHHESKSRGTDHTKSKKRRLAGELAALKRKWHTDSIRDPYHHPQLSPFCEQFLVAV